MSVVSDIQRIAPELFERTSGSCGKMKEALDVYDHWLKLSDLPVEKLKHMTWGLLDSVMGVLPVGPPVVPVPPNRTACVFLCVICECVPRQPTTTVCGHTFCRKCLLQDGSRTCRKCGQKINGCYTLETNIIVKGLVEKLWSGEIVAAELREEGNELLQRNELDAALAKYNEALILVPDNHLLLSNRSHVLCRMGRLQGALSDAEHVIRIRPHWGKGYYRRGAALLAMGHHEDALISLCVCAALDRNPQAVLHDVSKVLHHLLSRSLRTRNMAQARMRRPRYFVASSDCEDNSSGEEDLLPVPKPAPAPNIYVIVDSVLGEMEKLRRLEWKSVELPLEPSLLDKADLDCVLCCRTLWQPVTTPCGHTYCLACLDRSLDYSSACPLCMKSLSDYLAVMPKNVTEFLSTLVKVALPGEHMARQLTQSAEVAELREGAAERDPRIPVFVCTTAYPNIHCPLFIYEPRYRLMVRRCVEAGTRQFGIAACFNTESGGRRYADFGTMLEIRDWVLMSDGCSILSTVGVRRFKTLSRGERDGYDTAKVEFLQDDIPAPGSREQLALQDLHDRVRDKAVQWVDSFGEEFREQVVSSFGTMPDVEECWAQLMDGPSWCWWLLAILPLGPQLQVSILGTTSLEKRLRAIYKTLNHIQKTRS